MRRTLPLLAAILTCLTEPARATTVLDAPISQLAATSTAVVRGVVDRQQAAWNEDHSLIVTRTRLRVTQVLKGEAGATVTIRQVGGRLDGIAMGPAGNAEFRPGEEVVVFLEPHPNEAGTWVLTAMSAAKFSLRKDAGALVAERSLDGLSFAKRGADGVIRPGAPTSPSTLSWEALVREVAQARR